MLHDVSFQLKPGGVLGLLGRTGSGKTTLSRLLCRFYDPSAGELSLSGVDIRLTRLSDLRQRVGLVTQEVQLFQGSLRDNLTLFEETINDEKILTALRTLGLERALPNGLDTESVQVVVGFLQVKGSFWLDAGLSQGSGSSDSG